MESLIGSVLGNNLSFDDAESTSRSTLPPLPNEVPPPVFTRENIGIDLSRSATFEAVISQNEDLMNRLKVSLKRLAILETENQRLSEESNRSRLTFSSVKSQVDVYKEEAQEWRTQVQEKEVEIQRLSEINRALDDKSQKQTIELQRFEKFQEKIKAQVKPYLTEMKAQNKILTSQRTELENQLSRKDAVLSQMREQMGQIVTHSKEQIQILERNLFETTRAYETQIHHYTEDQNSKQNRIKDLEDQVFRLQKRVEKMDSVENELVSLQRTYAEITHKYKTEIDRLQTEYSSVNRNLSDAVISNEHFKQDLQSLQNQKFELETRLRNQDEQLDNIRQMWSQKCDELEKLKMSMNALERLNLELSTQLQRDRQSKSSP